MKLSLIILLFITNFSFGQKIAIGVKAGLALSNTTIKQVNVDSYNLPFKSSTRTSVLGGVYLDIPSGKKIIFRPGIEVVSKGARAESNYAIVFTYVDFPVNILYKMDYMNGHFVAGGGPVIGVPIKDYYSPYPLKTEFGINALVGYELASGFCINLNYSSGLSNASKNKQLIKKISNRYLGITLGYTF